MKSFINHWNSIKQASDETLDWYLEFLTGAHDGLRLTPVQESIVRQLYDQGWKQYRAASQLAQDITEQSLRGRYANRQRSPHFNQAVVSAYDATRRAYVDKGFISVLGGVTLVKQVGSIKHIYLGKQHSEPVVDVMGSATTLNLGAGFPLLAAIDLVEGILGIGDNFALVYHAGVHQNLYFDFLCSLYPNQAAEPQIFSESSGTAVNSVAIEAASAYAEQLGLPKTAKILAFQGTWSGGFGTAKEASSFGADTQHSKKAGLHWVDRCLKIPRSPREEQHILSVVKNKINSGAAAGIIFEKIIGDAGIIELSDHFVAELLKLCGTSAQGVLPVIVDEIQAGNGRSSDGYWSFSAASGLKGYQCLLVTNAKSAAGGKPYAFVLMPKVVAVAAYPLSMLTTHSGNGPVGRAVVYAKFITHPTIQAIKNQTASLLAKELHSRLGQKWRGRHLNIGIICDDGQELELLQNYLYIQYGILAGLFPATLRFQPSLIEYPDTLTGIIKIIEQALDELRADNSSLHSKTIADIKHKIAGQTGGLNF